MAEHDLAGVSCGIMNQFISVLGSECQFLLLDCRTRKTELVPMSDPFVVLLVVNTNVKHELGSPPALHCFRSQPADRSRVGLQFITKLCTPVKPNGV